LGLKQPENDSATEMMKAVSAGRAIGYPVLLRPSFVLGGRGMEIVHNEEGLRRYMSRAMEVSPGKPVLIDKFLQLATEVDVDCLSDGTRTVIGGVMQHIEEAGIHSGDSACVIPPHTLPADVIEEIKRQTRLLAEALHVKGLMNIQFAVTGLAPDGTTTEKPEVYVLEANPRASRTIPFVSKASGVQLARLAALVMVGKTLDELGVTGEVVPSHYSVKESVFPFNKFPGTDIILGPEMKSTGEVMGSDTTLAMAFAKAQLAASSPLPTKGTIFISVAGHDKAIISPVAKQFAEMGYKLLASPGTAAVLRSHDIPVEVLPKIQEGARPNILDKMKNNEIAMIINTPTGKGFHTDEGKIRSAAVAQRITCITTLSAAFAAVDACKALQTQELTVTALQDWFPTT
jgi:carbamoyl-phosphate synthase large subunit